MVPTRADKYKFTDGEKVLCYEPDPSKAKVLYDSKVLQVIEEGEGKTRKHTEYLIHFQGWNASWDRKVPEESVLKHTEENRILQTQLAEKSQIKLSIKSNRVLIGAGTQFDGRKRRRRLSETIRETIERERKSKEESDTSSQTTGTTEDDLASFASETEGSNQNGENEEESDEETFSKFAPVAIPNTLKEVLERDFQFVNENNKLVNLPSSKHVLCILEDYVKFFAIRHITRGKERRKSEQKEKERAFMTLDLCKEVMDGFRICFDFYVHALLLYPSERKQAETLKSVTNVDMISGQNLNEKMTLRGKENKAVVPEKDGIKDVDESSLRRVLRSKRSLSEQSMPNSEKDAKASQPALSESGRSTPTTIASDSSMICALKFPIGDLELLNYPIKIDGVYHDLKNWTLLPDDYRNPPSPVLVYGAIHLLRLFVKLPEILYRMNVTNDRKKVIVKHSDLFLKYLNLHIDELFKESDYVTCKS